MNGTDKKNLQLVKVYVRQRPFTQNEIELNRRCIVQYLSAREISLKSGSTEKKYNFDCVFGKDASQDEVYKVVVHPLIDYILSGYACTVFAYGQTGTGKTHTMIGQAITPNINFLADPSVGIVPRAAVHIFSVLSQLCLEYTITVSFIEIYNEEVRDLLVPDCAPLRIYDDPDNKGATCIKGLTETAVANIKEVYDLLTIGTHERHTASTLLNRHSSRSHTIFTLVVKTREITVDGEEIIKVGKLNLVDLAGSENIGRSGATDMRAREAGKINKSLLTLGKVIKSLALKMQHIPYRESKLTRILQDSLGGKSKTCMIATFAPCVDAFDETVSTLDYAYMARSVANCPTVNVNRKQTNIFRDMQDNVASLQEALDTARTGEGFHVTGATYDKMTFDVKSKNERVMSLVKEITRLEEKICLNKRHYDQLNQSFERTNNNVETVTKELEEKTIRQKEVEYIVKFQKHRAITLNEATHTLFNTCETSIKHGDIYHNKYQNQCTSTVYNANIARGISSTTNNSLKEIQNSSENFIKSQDAHLTDITTRFCDIKENHTKNLEETKLLASEIHSKVENHNFTFDGIFKDNSFSQSKIHDDLINLYNECYQRKSQKLQEIKASAGSIKEFICEKSADLEAQATTSSNMVRQAFSEDKAYFTKRNCSLDNFRIILNKRLTNVQEQLSHTRTLKELYVACQEAGTANRNSMKEELESLRQTEKESNEMRIILKSSTTALLDIEDTLVNFNQCLEPVKSVVSLMDNTLQCIEETQRKFQSQLESHGSKTREYFRGFITSFKDNLNYHTNELATCVNGWGEDLNTIKENFHTDTTSHKEHIETTVEHIISVQTTYDSDIKQFMQQSYESLENLRKNIRFKIHNGDTPVKPVYPKVVFPLEEVSVQELGNLFKKLNSSDSSV